MVRKCTTKCDARAKLLFGLIKPIVFIFLTFSLPSRRWILIRACLHGVGDPSLVGLCFFRLHALGNTKQKKLTPLDRGPPLHVNRVLGYLHTITDSFLWRRKAVIGPVYMEVGDPR